MVSILNATYAEVVNWRPNTFSVSVGRMGRNFVTELSRLYLAFGSNSPMEVIALKATIVLPILLLQKPSKRSKSKDHHTTCLERRLISWSNGDLEGILKECRALQQLVPKLGQPATTMEPNLAQNFPNLIFAGKLKAALDLLTNDDTGGLLHVHQHIDANDSNSSTVKDILISKHPASQPAYISCIISSDPEDPHPIIFESLVADLAALYPLTQRTRIQSSSSHSMLTPFARQH